MWLQPAPPFQSIYERQCEAILLNIFQNGFNYTKEAALTEKLEQTYFQSLKKKLCMFLPSRV
jgi:hypothetical protein